MMSAEEELQRSVAELRREKVCAEEGSKARDRFLATMSHELRTPMHGIIGSADLLLGTELNAEQIEIVQLLRRSGSSLLTIVNDILDYSRIEAGMMPIEAIPLRLADCVREVIDLQASVATTDAVGLRWQIDPALPAVVSGDPGRLRQVLNNLVNNAVKFTPRGEVVVAVEATGEPGLLRFVVRDTGVGIRPEALPALFQAFVQEEASTTRRFGGTGLGLAICRRLVRLMGGDIEVQSTPGTGSVFTFTCRLPAAEVHPWTRIDDAPAGSSGFGGARVLVVDDHDANRLLMMRMLERLGCVASECADGLQTVQRLAHEDFDLVLMDCKMPVLDGYGATEALRQLPGPTGRIPIVALTANAMPEDRQRCLDVGMNGFLTKPVRLHALRAEIGRWLDR